MTQTKKAPMKRKKFAPGTEVKPTKEAIRWYQEHLFEIYMRPNSDVGEEYITEVAMWLGAGYDTPVGKVIAGTPLRPDVDVRVKLSNAYGSYEGYFEKSHLLRKVWAK